MPAVPRAAAAAPPASSSRLVRRISGGRVDSCQAGDHAIEVLHDLSVRQRLRNVLAGGIEGALPVPRVEDVPLVDVPVHRVDGDEQVPDPAVLVGVAEAGHRAPTDLPGYDLDVLAAGDRRPAGIAAEVHVHVLTRRLMP